MEFELVCECGGTMANKPRTSGEIECTVSCNECGVDYAITITNLGEQFNQTLAE